MRSATFFGPVALLALIGCSNDIQVSDRANVAPAASINSPTNGVSLVAGQNVDFAGTVADGNGLDDIVTVTWNSSIDGEIASNELATPDAAGLTRVSSILSAGQHAITLRAVDSAGEVGEDTINVSVGDADVEPSVAISEPALFADYFLGEIVDLSATSNDPQDPVDSLTYTWVAENTDTSTLDTILQGSPDANGLITGTWEPVEVGGYVLTLTVVDPDGNMAEDSVAIEIEDQGGADLDGDGFSANSGDCDDGDASINPNASEVCADAIDNDCSGVVDDKDEDNDQHVDSACVNYTGALPIDDCDDADSQTYPGAGEQQDGIDNDCDGFLDEDTQAFDDDGDCYCEVGPCIDSVEPTCATLEDGDCDDSDPLASPGGADTPDIGFIDENCDGVDGTVTDMVFLDPLGGNDGLTGLETGQAVGTWARALSVASTSGRSWIAIADGTIDLRSGNLVEGVSIAGGYDTANSWARSGSIVPAFEVSASGQAIDGWSTQTEIQHVDFIADNATGTGGSSIVLRVNDTSNLILSDVLLEAGSGTDGSDASAPSTVLPGSNGSPGAEGQDNDGGDGGAGAANCDATSTGGAGGEGGFGECVISWSLCDCTVEAGDMGNPGTLGGGGGGAGGPSGANPGVIGSTGAPGAAGMNGAGGTAAGVFSFSGYVTADGQAGSQGEAGKSGGGGGGGGADVNLCTTATGGGGGGGGGGGCGGNPGSGGTGGGGSIGLLMEDSSVTIEFSTVTTDEGGSGGAGASGSAGGQGGIGGPGGPPENFVGLDGGYGGPGGIGGPGGNGGAGGGGGGGPSIGIVCTGSSQLIDSNVGYQTGPGGAGGASSGQPGATGMSVDTDGC